MNQYCNSRVGLYRPRVGEMCLAKFSEGENNDYIMKLPSLLKANPVENEKMDIREQERLNL